MLPLCPKCSKFKKGRLCLICDRFETLKSGMREEFHSTQTEIATSRDNEIATTSKNVLLPNGMQVDRRVIVHSRKRHYSNDIMVEDIQAENKRRVETCKNADRNYHVDEDMTSASTNHSASDDLNSLELDSEFPSIAKSRSNYSIQQSPKINKAKVGISHFGLSTGEGLNSIQQAEETQNVGEDSSINQESSIENCKTSKSSLVQNNNLNEPSGSMHLPQQISVSNLERKKQNISPRKTSRGGCQIVFYNEIANENLIAAKGVESKSKPFKCKFCNYTTSILKYFKSHLERMHNMDISFQCDKCEKKYGTRNQLIIHYGSHMGKKVFQCDECDYVSDFKINIQIHKGYKHT